MKKRRKEKREGEGGNERRRNEIYKVLGAPEIVQCSAV